MTITIDDHFPCYPLQGPLFSSTCKDDLWLLILEKAYAKLHGCYCALRGGSAHEALLDLTGCPTTVIGFKEGTTVKRIESGEFWDMMKGFDNESCLVSANTLGSHAYTVLGCKETSEHQLVNLRSPWAGAVCPED